MSRNGIYLLDAVYLVVPEHHPEHAVGIGQGDVHRIPLHAEVATVQLDVVAYVQAVHQPAQEHVAVQQFPLLDVNDVVVEVRRVSHTVDARHGRHHNDILPSREQGRGGRQPQLVDFLVDGQVLFYIGVGRRDVCLRLIIVIVRHVVFHGVVREEVLELPVELCGQRLVVAQDEGRLVHVLDDIGNGESLSGAGDPQQGLCGYVLHDAFGQLSDGFRLVAGGLIVGYEFEIHEIRKLVN
ncbi:unknown [Bacteroides sp. CAG:875]|nr:unknown [Bacteroides sp. CAG:875]